MSKTEAILRALRASGAFEAARYLTRRKLRILCYHGLWLGGAPHYGDCLYMDPKKFEERMEWLAASRYPVLGLDEALRRLDDGSLPDNAVVITIDDGWYSTYRGMVPVLVRLGLPATVYVTTYYATRQIPVLNVLIQHMLEAAPRTLSSCYELLQSENALPDAPSSPVDRAYLAQELTGQIDSRPYSERWPAVEKLAAALDFRLEPVISGRLFHLMSEDEIRGLAALGMDIQLHTHTHRMHEMNASRVAEEIRRNRITLARILDRGPEEFRHFCFPSGVFSSEIFRTLRDLGMLSATTTRSGLVDKGDERMELNRILDCQSLSLIELEARVCGLWHLLSVSRARLAR